MQHCKGKNKKMEKGMEIGVERKSKSLIERSL
jgi:hypothetical protein